MKLKIQAKHIGKMVQEQSPLILTAVGVVGTIATAYLAGKASFQAHAVIESRDDEEGYIKVENRSPLSNKQKSLLVWKLYIPAAGVGAMTVLSIVAANRIQARRMAALVGAYAVLSGDFDEYKGKALEVLGVKKVDELDTSVARDKMTTTPPPTTALDGSKSWFCDLSTMRYFPSTMESVKYAQNSLNHMLNNQVDVSLNDFYDKLGLEATAVGDLLQWDSGEQLELNFSAVLMDEGGAATAFRFAKNPHPKGR